MRYSAIRCVGSLLCALLLLLSGCGLSPHRRNERAIGSVVFTAAGDYGSSGAAGATMDRIRQAAPDFHLALGDLSYGSLRPETAWCNFVTQRVGRDFPFQLIAGNHDVDGGSPGEHIDEFAKCLPNRLGLLTGEYGRQYYFDYPVTRPVARVIMVSPQALIGGQKYSYLPGSDGYSWVVEAINSARQSGIKWIIVGSHQPCLSTGRYPCEMGADLFNLLVQQRVDLILTGHDHTYQRSKQLATSPSCPAIEPDLYNEACVVSGGSTDRYTKGAGPVQLVIGTGGVELFDIVFSDPEVPYMATTMGVNSNPAHGLVRFAISDTGLTAEFLPSTGEGFTDAFTITGIGSGPPPPPPAAPVRSIIADDALWRYFDGDHHPMGWERMNFNDSQWKSGQAKLGYGDGDESTTIGYGNDPDNKPPTAYFRHTFELSSPAAHRTVELFVKCDDGAIVYLNGRKLMSTNMPKGEVDHTTLAATSVDDTIYYRFNVRKSLLKKGKNVVAVEVHQAAPDSSDLSFALAIAG